MKMAYTRVKELELVYGRGEFQILKEKPSIPDATKLNEESDKINNEFGNNIDKLIDAFNIIKTTENFEKKDVEISQKIINHLFIAIADYNKCKDKHVFC